MNKLLVLTLVFGAAFSNLDALSTRMACPGMMGPVQESKSCCPSSEPCDCSIQVPTQNQVLPAQNPTIPAMSQNFIPVVASEIAPPADFSQGIQPFESPPKQAPLFQLYSVYRV